MWKAKPSWRALLYSLVSKYSAISRASRACRRNVRFSFCAHSMHSVHRATYQHTLTSSSSSSYTCWMCPHIKQWKMPPSTHTTPWQHFIIDVGLMQRGYSIPNPVLLKCCVASIVAQSIVLYRTCTGQPAVWGFVSLGLTHCGRVFLF